MHEKRTEYPKKKAQMYQLLQDLPKKYNVTALVRMEKSTCIPVVTFKKKNFWAKWKLLALRIKLYKNRSKN